MDVIADALSFRQLQILYIFISFSALQRKFRPQNCLILRTVDFFWVACCS